MRKLFFLLFFVYSICYSQVPQKMSHRGTAYNASGQVLSNTQIKVRVSIFEGSTTGTLLFFEEHNHNLNGSLVTNQNGQYNIEIGTSSYQSAPFSSINWGSNSEKWLEIGIAQASNPNNYVIGASQLLSVPYALHSQSAEKLDISNGGFEIATNIEDLINNVKPENKKLVYVKGYYIEGDGGGGMFIFKENSNLPTNLGTIFQSNITTDSPTGRWIRQYSGYLNVAYFGVKKGWISDTIFSNSDRIQNAIDYANLSLNYNNEFDKTVFFSNGEYFVDKPIILKNHVKILGSSGTMFTVRPNTTYDYMIKIAKGPLVHCEIHSIHLNLNNNPNIGGIHFKAEYDPLHLTDSHEHGGIWNSVLKNIYIGGLRGNGIFLEGGEGTTGTDDDYRYVNQFLTFENVHVSRLDEKYNSIRMTGQHGQITFLNCTFDGSYTSNVKSLKGVNVFIGRQDENPDYGSNIAVVSFINSTFQASEYGVVLEGSQNITFDNCWLENLDIGFSIRNSRGINILNNRFANAAGCGSTQHSTLSNHSGRCIDASSSFVNINNNYVAVSDPANSLVNNDYFVLGLGNDNILNVNNNSFQHPILSKTFGIMQTILINANTIDLNSKKLIFVNSYGIINRIESTVNAGETVFLRANSLNGITFQAMNPTNETGTRNIYLNGRTSLFLKNGQGATFIKIDNIVGTQDCTYQLVSISN